MICTKCDVDKPESEFSIRHRKGKKTRHRWCKLCMSRYQTTLLNRKKAILIQERGGKCEECGFKGHPAIFDFHHRDPTQKDYGISEFRCHPLSKLRKEVEKCDLLCANCHRLKHLSVHGWDFDYENPEIDDLTIDLKLRQCPKCKNKKHPASKLCQSCALKRREKTIWPRNLPELVTTTSKSAVARQLNVSVQAVNKRLKNHH